MATSDVDVDWTVTGHDLVWNLLGKLDFLYIVACE